MEGGGEQNMIDKDAVQKKLLAIIQEELQQAIDCSTRLAEAVKEINNRQIDVSITVISAVDICERPVNHVEGPSERKATVASVTLNEKDRQFLQSLGLSY